jgi:hypothetical protein
MKGLEDSWSDTFWVVYMRECFANIWGSTTLKCLHQVLALAMSRIDTNMKACILVETKVQLQFQNWEVEIPC